MMETSSAGSEKGAIGGSPSLADFRLINFIFYKKMKMKKVIKNIKHTKIVPPSLEGLVDLPLETSSFL